MLVAVAELHLEHVLAVAAEQMLVVVVTVEQHVAVKHLCYGCVSILVQIDRVWL